MTIVRDSAPACPRPCNECPWLTANHGKPHPHGWYTKTNLARLWRGLRQGERMSCHRTDPDNLVPDGHKTVPEGTTTHECTGGLILQQRELMLFQKCGEESRAAPATSRGESSRNNVYRRYRAAGGTMTKTGLAVLVERALFGRWPGSVPMAKPNLNEPVSR